MARRRTLLWLGTAVAVLLSAAVAVAFIWGDDVLEALLDPQVPYTVYHPPPAPEYAMASAWDQLPSAAETRASSVDVFFIHPTTFDGGKDWNSPIDNGAAATLYARVVAPNFAAPFAAAGRVFAPRFRQASLYTSLTVFDDAIEAREFAYRDIAAAFEFWLRRMNSDRPFILVGVEQGGTLAERLLTERIAPDPALRRRLVAAYLIESPTPVSAVSPGAATPICQARMESGCVIAWISARVGDIPRVINILTRGRIWSADGRLIPLAGAQLACVNPLLGRASDADAPARLNLGAANATGLEWGTRPGFMVRQVGARCEGGILRVTAPRSNSLRPHGGFAERLRTPPYNPFWADLEADALSRVAAYRAKSLNPRG